jgi:flagella basal body P-ring formation protein FlgA
MRLIKTTLLSLLLVTLSFSTLVVFKDGVKISGSTIKLGDIATISGSYKSSLENMDLGKSAQPGESRFVGGAQAVSFLALDSVVRAGIDIRGASRTRVTTVHRELSIISLTKKIEELLMDSISWSKEDVSFSLMDSGVIKISPEGFELSIEQIRSPYKRGNMRISLLITQPNFRRVVTVKAFLKVETEVYMATKELIRGDKLTTNSLALKKMDISTVAFKPLDKTCTIAGLKVKNIVRNGALLNTRFLLEVPTVESGSVVRIIVPMSTGFLSTKGIARQNGKVGEMIAIENIDSKKIIRATVVKSGVVKVVTGGNV